VSVPGLSPGHTWTHLSPWPTLSYTCGVTQSFHSLIRAEFLQKVKKIAGLIKFSVL